MENSSSLRVSITTLTFHDATTVAFAPTDVVLVVGPNNAGKSALLRAIRDKLENAAHSSPVVRGLAIQREGKLEHLTGWLSGWTVQRVDSSPDNPIFQALGHSMYQSQARDEWQRPDHTLGQLSRWFCRLLSADDRLQACNPPTNIALARDNPSHPIHFLLRDDGLEAQLSAEFRKAFGVDLVVHRNAGNQVPLHIGDRPKLEGNEDRVSRSYIERLEKLPTLHSQGDGMRSFAGVLLATSVGRESMMLIDEPEAFLHPPQARLLGAILVKDGHQDRQLFIATHSTDILRGILDSESRDVKVVRISRTGTVNSVRLLSNERIKELWGDPLLRYSNILDGLFHESVIVCESDADCRFYAAMLDAITSRKADAVKRPDLMFTHCGGKARMPLVIRALREVNVPVRAVADFDILSERETLKNVTDALGLDWATLEPDWRAVKTAVENKKPDLQTDDVRREIQAVLSVVDGAEFPLKAKKEIHAILKRASPWAHAKGVGKNFVPSGDPMRACDRLLERLGVGGLFVVEVGELESHVKTEGGHGPKWVNAVLTRNLEEDAELETAREFVRGLAGL